MLQPDFFYYGMSALSFDLRLNLCSKSPGAHGRVTRTKLIEKGVWTGCPEEGCSFEGEQQDEPNSTLARTHQGRWKQFPIQRYLVLFLPGSSLSLLASIRKRNSLWSPSKSPISHRRHVLFIKEGGKLDHCLRATEQYCYTTNNCIKARSHWEATFQDNKERKKEKSFCKRSGLRLYSLLTGQFLPSRSHLFSHLFIYFSNIFSAPLCAV